MIIYKDHKLKHELIPKQYALFLDDDPNRIPHKLSWIDLPTHNWVIVRSYKEFVQCIEEYGLPVVCSYDHDLADEHYMAHYKTNNIPYHTFKEKSGYDCAKYMAEYCINKDRLVPRYFVHTLNPIGKLNIISILEMAKKQLDIPNCE